MIRRIKILLYLLPFCFGIYFYSCTLNSFHSRYQPVYGSENSRVVEDVDKYVGSYDQEGNFDDEHRIVSQNNVDARDELKDKGSDRNFGLNREQDETGGTYYKENEDIKEIDYGSYDNEEETIKRNAMYSDDIIIDTNRINMHRINTRKRILSQSHDRFKSGDENLFYPEDHNIIDMGDAPVDNGFIDDAPPVNKYYSIKGKQEMLDESLRLCQQAQQDWEEGDPEAALESLDSAYELLINVNTNGDTGIFQQKEDIRFLISKRIVEIYASRQRVANGKHTEIPLVMNAYVEREIKNFLGEERDYFINSYKMSGLYRPMILNELREAGLPESLSWLPLIESGFKTRALSHARALGLWQFIPSTGYKFGLERNRWIDERMDPLKSTRAAIEYLTELHHIFGDWTTVLAAYNCGEGAVLRVIRDQHINYLDNFWDIYEQLPLETARYVPKFIATLFLIENKEEFGLKLPAPYEPVQYAEFSVNKQIRLSDLASKLDLSLKELIAINPELRQQITPDTDYLLNVPSDKLDLASASIDTIPQWQPPSPSFILHRIKRGETLSHIAKRYGTTVKRIASVNNIRWADRIWIGQKLKIPLKGQRQYADAGIGDNLGTYVVKKGDCAFAIARMFRMNLSEFLKINSLSKDSIIYPGQKVLVRGR